MAASSASVPLAFPATPRRGHFGDGWTKFALFLIVGYLCMSRSFAYLGIPPLSIYIGEVSLAAFLLFGPRTRQGRWPRVAFRAQRLRRLGFLILLSLGYGAFEALRGVLAGFPALVAARDTAFNYYPLFLFLGMWVGLQRGDFTRRVVRMLAWWNGCYGLAYVLFLSRLPWTMQGTASAASAVPVFSEPYGSAVALLGLIAFEPNLGRVWYLAALNASVMLAVQVRAEWVGFAVGLLMLAGFTKRLKRLAVAGAFVVVLLVVMHLANINLPSPEARGGRISVDSIVARALAPLNKDLAYDLTAHEDLAVFAGTATWRLVWWTEIWNEVHRSSASALFGFGYGYPIGDLNPAIPAGEFIQTPHNGFFYALGFSGWLGVAFFVLLQVEIERLLLRSYRATGQLFGLMCWAALLTTSLFEDFFEAPFGAIPFYLLIGIAVAPGLLSGGGPSSFGNQREKLTTNERLKLASRSFPSQV